MENVIYIFGTGEKREVVFYCEQEAPCELKPALGFSLMPYHKYRAVSSLTLTLRSLAGYSCNAPHASRIIKQISFCAEYLPKFIPDGIPAIHFSDGVGPSLVPSRPRQ